MAKVNILVIIIFLVSTINPFYSHADKYQVRVSIKSLEGNAEAKSVDKEKWMEAEKGVLLEENEIFKTLKDSRAEVVVAWNGQIVTLAVEENTQLMFAELNTNKQNNSLKIVLDVAIGKILIKKPNIKNKKIKIEVKTPTTLIDVKKAEFTVEVKAEK